MALDLGEKQSSPILTQARSILTCSTLSESKKSVFLGNVVALLDSAVQTTSVNEISLAEACQSMSPARTGKTYKPRRT